MPNFAEIAIKKFENNSIFLKKPLVFLERVIYNKGTKGDYRGLLGIFWKGGITLSLLLAGKETRKFDQVNRMAIPPSFRKELGETVIVMKSIHKEPCLILFSEEEWANFSYGVISAFTGEKQAAAQRRLADRVEKVTVDKSGRISIKDDYKAYAGLEDEVLAVGAMNRVELWTPENWAAWNAESENDDFDFGDISYSTTGRP